MTLKEKSDIIKSTSSELGFIGCGISRVVFLDTEASRLKSWIEQGLHGSMEYLRQNFDKRLDPEKMVPGARSMISVLMNYATNQKQKDPEAPVLSKYAYGEDYHFVMKRKLKELLTIIQNKLGSFNGRIFVDSAPVLERVWAARSGLGWIGKHSLLLNRTHGSFFFIGELVVDIELAYDTSTKDYCGDCTRCIDACPTGAIIRPHVVDGSRCISYFTIEHNNGIPEQYRGQFKNRVFGCDICQDVCPWNLNAIPHQTREFLPQKGLLDKTWEEWYQITEEEYRQLFRKSAVKRAKFKGLRRNLEFIRHDTNRD